MPKGYFEQQKNVFLYIIVLVLFGCAAPVANQRQISLQQIENARGQHYVNSHPSLPEDIRQNILNGVIQIGMTKEMVMAAIGEPNNIQRSGDASGIREVWVYYAPLPELPETDPSSLAGLTPEDVQSAYNNIALAYLIAQSRRKATYLFFIDGLFTSFREQ